MKYPKRLELTVGKIWRSAWILSNGFRLWAYSCFHRIYLLWIGLNSFHCFQKLSKVRRWSGLKLSFFNIDIQVYFLLSAVHFANLCAVIFLRSVRTVQIVIGAPQKLQVKNVPKSLGHNSLEHASDVGQSKWYFPPSCAKSCLPLFSFSYSNWSKRSQFILLGENVSFPSCFSVCGISGIGVRSTCVVQLKVWYSTQNRNPPRVFLNKQQWWGGRRVPFSYWPKLQ